MYTVIFECVYVTVSHGGKLKHHQSIVVHFNPPPVVELAQCMSDPLAVIWCYLWMGLIQIWSLSGSMVVFRMQSDAKCFLPKTLRCSTPRVLLTFLSNLRRLFTKDWFCSFFVACFLSSSRTTQTVRQMQTLYISRNWSNIGDLPFLV